MTAKQDLIHDLLDAALSVESRLEAGAQLLAADPEAAREEARAAGLEVRRRLYAAFPTGRAGDGTYPDPEVCQ